MAAAALDTVLIRAPKAVAASMAVMTATELNTTAK